ncbi:hypothetical protein ACP4OV_017482 [Aristida adscensionis]
MLLLRKHLPLLLRTVTPRPSPLHLRGLLSTSAAASVSAAPFSLEGYLVAACGLDPAQARKASKKALEESKASTKAFEGLSSPRLGAAFDPDAVLAVLSGAGLTRAEIAAAVAADPLLLRSSAGRLAARVAALRDRVGLSARQIARFLLVGSRALRACGDDIAAKLEFFSSFCGSFELLLAFVKANHKILLSRRLERVVKPNIAQLRQCGLSVRDIVQLGSRPRSLLLCSPELVKEFLERAEKLGVPRGSRLMKSALAVTSHVSEENVAAKLELLKRTLGCSENEVATAVSKVPLILTLSEESLLLKTQFLMNEVGMEPQGVLGRPHLYTYSLEKRLAPRYRVMEVLRAKGLLQGNIRFSTLAVIGEQIFRLRFIDCHKDSVIGLADAYAEACSGDFHEAFKRLYDSYKC